MQIQSGKLYENKTWRYLYPCLKYYGEDLMENLARLFKLGVGVGDLNKKDSNNCIYILIDTNIPLVSDEQRADYKQNFSKFLDWLSYKNYYISDYIFEYDKHMIVLKIPSIYDITYLSFVKGEYSNMYTVKVINDYFKYLYISNKEIEQKQNKKLRNTRNVLTKDVKYLQTFVDKVNFDFKTNVSTKYFVDAELDYPPKKEEEIFNYKDVKGE